MDMIGKVRRMHFRDHFSLSEIARRTGLSRNTVKKWAKAPVGREPKYRRSEQPGKLSEFHATLRQALTADGHRPRSGRRTARALYAQIKAAGYAGGYANALTKIRKDHEDIRKALALDRDGMVRTIKAIADTRKELDAAHQALGNL